ncbi:MAG: C1 family peptidase [Candidatus Aminicenantes bacterium]|nr:C1 family peptidase [Candidatus Aminicenantes bacterium]
MTCKRVVSLILTSFLVIASLFAEKDYRGITPDVLKILETSVNVNAPQTKALINAVSANDVGKLVVNKRVKDSLFDWNFSFRLKTKGVTNQKSSGRCWLFAGLNILRYRVAQRLNLEKFELSQSYNFFYDKLEKANLFLEKIIETRNRPIGDRTVDFLLKNPIPDGGQWNMVVALVNKYGVVPKEIMPETYNTSNTRRINQILATLLRRDAAILRESKKSEVELRKMKIEMLKDVYRLLVYTFGVPPKQFKWRYKDKNGKISPWKTYTPQSFFKEFVNVDLNDYVVVYNCPAKKYYKLYSISLDRDMADRQDLTFLNLPIEEVKKLTLKTLTQDKEPVWFGCDVGKELLNKDGIMAPDTYDYKSLLGIDLSMTKKQIILYRHSIPTHAMVFTGVDLGPDGKPIKWLVENSWGSKAGKNGMYVMYDKWFDYYLYEVVIPKKNLTPEMLKLLKQKPIVVPPWDPMYDFFSH